MGAFDSLDALQKLRHFLAGVFPALERAGGPVSGALARVVAHPTVVRLRERFESSRWSGPAKRLFLAFGPEYAGARLDWARMPPDGIALLRAVMPLGALVCLLLPLAMLLPSPALALAPGRGPVAAWSVALWMIGLAAAWGCLLAGGALANRVAAALAAALFMFLMGMAATGLPRAWGNVLLVLPVLTVIAVSERRSVSGSRAAGVTLALALGVGAGVVLVALTPIAAIVPGRVAIAGVVAGVPLGLAARAVGRRGIASMLPAGDAGLPAAHRLAAFIATCTLVFLGVLAFRGGLAVPAAAILDSLTLWTAYFWPLYYLIGVGIVFGLLNRTEVLTVAAREIVPARYFVPAGILVVVAGVAMSWSSEVLTTPSVRWPAAVLATATFLYQHTASWIWRDPVTATAMDWMKWVLLLDVLALVWFLVRRGLDGGRMASLLFLTLLAWLVTFEYVFQFSGFARAPGHSALGMFVFATGLLWLVHRTGSDFVARSSPAWPSAARIALYGGTLLVVLVTLHARAATRDTRFASEVFLYFFRGIVDLGVPCGLYIYASRRLPRLPVEPRYLLGAFGLGALLTAPLAVLDKLALAGGSIGAARASIEAQAQALLVRGDAGLGRALPALPALWVTARGAIVLTVLSAFAVYLGRRAQGGPGARLFVLVAAALGVASFSNRSLDLPLLPVRLELWMAPLRQSIVLDVSVVALYLAYALPALLLGWCLARPGGIPPGHRLAAAAGAFGLYSAVTLAWPGREAWLRSTGALAPAGLAGLVLFVFMAQASRRRLEEALRDGAPADPNGAPPPSRAVDWRATRALVAAVLTALIAVVLWLGYSARLVPRPVEGWARSLPLPAFWNPVAPRLPGVRAGFRAAGFHGYDPLLLVDLRPAPEGSAGLLAALVQEARRSTPGFAAARQESWNDRYRGAIAVDFRFSQALRGGGSQFLEGTTAVLPLADGDALVLTLVHGFRDGARRWDLVRVAERLGGR